MRLSKLKNWFGLADKVLSINNRNIEFIYRYNPRKYYPVADDKTLTKRILEKLDIATPQNYALIKLMGEIDLCWPLFKNHSSLVVKPAGGRGGSGILVLDKKEHYWITPSQQTIYEDDLKAHISDIIFGNFSLGISDVAMIEERVIQHPMLSEIYPNGIADIRMIMLQGKLLMAMSRIPTDLSNGRANLHQGALGVEIDLKSGKFGLAYNYKRYLDKHPNTKTQIKDRNIPYWEKIKDISSRLAENVPLKYIGIDIVIDQKKGPLVMEINARPGLEIQNVNQKGLLEQLVFQ